MSNLTPSIAVIGAGSWGTSLAILLAGKGYPVRLWGHNKEHIDRLISDGENSRYLPGISLPESLYPTPSLEKAVLGAQLVLMVVPSHVFRTVFRDLIPFLPIDCQIVSAVKGIENSTLSTMHMVMAQELAAYPALALIELGVISGPSFAKEVAQKQPTAVTVGFASADTAKKVQDIFSTDYFRVYTSTDIDGLEISGAFKNVMAIAAGISDGLSYGSNARAALITRGLAEMQRLGAAMNADPATFAGLSGLGDLLLTCTGDLSRNRNVGLQLGKGHSIEHIESEMFMVAEGVKTTKSFYDLARKLDVETPILDEVYHIIYEGKDCSQAVQDLLGRKLKPE
ncbi:NAD(P)H-dependent glycerol-3-phosphate dehydrogenase [Desulfotalea psychrophila]|uniref:Glycerol-3-phosphate dehydrogenase [NAD(P)+] n=1 Tax=Desulfotalea psychrophila (strain LSv54 / DSM 12343) TaxID=177439 RepID=GPDA_DESPS|nr:NAD(P)H-dependent glycerol-3-phosphate dehydrogenase [Desulfotalea psychrophila]Q6AQJ3.1 RecName: Full=Glycerol-3-phosphate dehydrogenase [NAD(P)+]; AltName: Full=NAD(P)H-dependent glycerol-3-phosphate dehydrogenase [Desulfotalea psychrophila LSv54]CAG35380.1 probable glycerol-3-phosphate dehydrogenase [Desulfotalea psychrophila LSv54]